MKESLKKLQSMLPDGVDAAIIMSDLNRRYFTDMKSSAGTLLVTKTNLKFIIDFRYIEKAKTVITDFDVELQDKLYEQINAFFKNENVKNIAVETDSMTVMQLSALKNKLPDFNFVNDDKLSDLINKLRSYKTKDEVENIKSAQAITDKTFTHILDFIKPGITEREVAVEMEYTMRKLGADALAFESIVVSGKNSSLPHGVPTNKKIEIGDFVTMDFGAMYDGYCSDMTRTIAVGKISDEQKKVYETVKTAQQMAIDAIKIGMQYKEIDKVARDYIYSNGYEGCFGHGLGHSLGLFIHESPAFNTTCSDLIEKDVVITVEPGVYLSQKFGVRIEDMVLITENGVEDLTHSEKKLITL